MGARAAPRKLSQPASRRQMCGYSLGVSTAFISAFLCMFLMCFFFLDMEMIYRKAGFAVPASSASAPVTLYNYGLGHSASQSLAHLMNSTNESSTKDDEEFVEEPLKTVAKEEESVVKEETEITVAEGEPETPVAEGEPETPVAEGEPETPVAEGELETPAAEGELETPVAEGELETPAAEGELETTVAEGELETPVAEGEPETEDEETPLATESGESSAKEEEEDSTDVIPVEEILMPPEEGEEATVEGEEAPEPVVGEIEMENGTNSLVGCDLSEGQWVYDNVTYPLYHTRNCPFADPGFRCEENGRPDLEWMSYHWKPHGCHLPRFNATDILERLRGQRMVFVGDSLGRNTWESMLCMLAEGVPDKSKIYEVYGEPITKHSGKLVYRFDDYNCTVEYYRDPFLVPQTRPPRGTPSNVKCVLRVDHVSWSVDKWWDADIIIFNAGHWWTEHKIFRQNCRFQVKNKVNMEYDVPTGLGKALRTWAEWLEEHMDTKKSQLFWLSFPTVHFRGGSWNHGGHCDHEHRPLTEEEVRAEWQTPWMNQIVMDEFMARLKKTLNAVTYLDITSATNYRSDGHGARYTWDTKKFGLKPRNHQDCSHFCLPGVPDAWNELVLASLFVKGKGTWAQSE